MKFINPKTDFAFKKIFGSDQSHAILISFLNGMLYKGNSTIQDLEILNPYQAPKVLGIKATYLDIRAKLISGEMVIIEMQVLNVAGFEKRVLYNAAKAYSMQLDSGQSYSTLNPVIALTIVDFELFPGVKEVISRFILKERQMLIDYPINDLELVFVELPKFKLTLNQLATLTDQWLYFFQNAPGLRSVPPTMRDVPEIQQAFTIAEQARLTRDEIDELERQSFYIYNQEGALIKATEDAEKRGLERGLEQGLERGLEQGKLDIARRLLALLDNEAIAQSTGLSIEEIQALR